MAYERSEAALYQWGQDATFGATTVTHEIVGPRGKVGLVRDLSVDITTSIVGTTFVPEICVGLSSGDITFGRYCLGTTASTAYTLLGMRTASDELITTMPPRSLSDYAPARTSFTTGPRLFLDGYPYSTGGSITGGSSTTQNPAGRIPAGPFTITSVVSGTAGVCRYFTREPVYPLTVGQTMQVTNVAGATGANSRAAISALSTSLNYFELTGTSFGGAYTSGGLANVVVVVSLMQGSGSAAGGGYVRVKIQWIGDGI